MSITALVRAIPRSYHRCLREDEVEIDVDRARRQHREYVKALEALGARVLELPALDDDPDSVFVEDVVVVLDRHAVLTRPGAPSRRGEGESLVPFIEGFELVRMKAPATLDGGDVLRVGRFVFVGLSKRTNREGFELLAEVARAEDLEPVAVEVRGGLHLKSACTALGSSVIGRFERIDRAPFVACDLELVDAPEPMGANVLDLGAGVLVSAAAPKTAALLGERARIIELGEIHKGDGALTCMSVRFADEVRAGRR
jgi:dimethylargininase